MENIEIISKGSFIDKGCTVTTITFRILGELMNEYIICDASEDEVKKDVFARKIIELVGLKICHGVPTLKNIISEIFTLVTIEEIGCCDNEK